MANVEDLGNQTTAIFDQSASGSAMQLLGATAERVQEMAAAFDQLVGADNDQDHVRHMRERMQRMLHGLGEIASEAAGLDDGVQELFAAWGIVGFVPSVDVLNHTDVPVPERVPAPAAKLVKTEVNPLAIPGEKGYYLEVSHFMCQHPNLAAEALPGYSMWNTYTKGIILQANVTSVVERIKGILNGTVPGDNRTLSALYATASLQSSGSKAEARALKSVKQAVGDAVWNDTANYADTLLLDDQNASDRIGQAARIPGAALPNHLQGPDVPDALLHILINAADIVSGREQAVVPGGRVEFGPSPDPKKRQAPVPVKSDERKRFRTLTEMGAYNSQIDQKHRLVTTLHGHLERHYQVTISNSQVLSFLAEARIAERIGLQTAPYGLQQSVQVRLDEAWRHLTPAESAQLTPLYRRITGV